MALKPMRLKTRSSASLSFFFNDTATTEIYTLSLHDALPISLAHVHRSPRGAPGGLAGDAGHHGRVPAQGRRFLRRQPRPRPAARRALPPPGLKPGQTARSTNMTTMAFDRRTTNGGLY